MNARTWLRERHDRGNSESGFTLIELIITLVLMSLIAGAIGAAFVGSLNATSATKQRVRESDDAQLIAGFLTRDAQAAGGTDPTTGVPDGSLGVSTTNNLGCGTGAPLVRFAWIDHSATVATKYVSAYYFDSTANQLVRTICVGGGSGASSPLGNNIVSVGSPASPFAWCNDDESATCPNFPDTVSLRITERDPSNPSAIPFTVVLKASLRPQSTTHLDTSPASAASLLLLGRTCPVGGDPSIAGQSAAFSLTIYGQAAIGGCATDLKKTVNAFGQVFVYAPGTCDDFPSPCTVIQNQVPTDPFQTRIAAGQLTAPPVNCSGTAPAVVGGHWQPGTYPQDPQKTGTVHPFDPGVYVFCNGLSGNVTANIQGGPIGGTFFYFSGGAFNGLDVQLTPPTTGQYNGLALWQPAANTSTMTFTKSLVNITGTVYAPSAIVGMKNGSVNINQLIAFAIDGDPGNPNIRIGPPLHVQLDDPMPPATQLQPYGPYQALALNGTGVYNRWSMSISPALPNLVINANTGVISGTPSVGASPGVHTVTVTAHDTDNEVASFSASITVYPALTISGDLPDWNRNKPGYPSNPLTAGGGSGTGYVWSWAPPIPGLNMAADGTITGTPNTAGTFTTTVTLTDSIGDVTTQSYTVVITAASKLAIVSGAVNGAASATALRGPITVQLQDIASAPVNASAATVISLSSNSAGTAVFSATSGGGNVTQVTIPAGSSSATFYYGDTKAGTPTITAASAGLTSATQQETITAAAVAKLCFVVAGTTCVSGTQTVGNGGTFTAKVQLTDAFGNPVLAGSLITVTLSGGGNLQTPSPTSVTILAGQSQSASVSDTLNNGNNRSGTLTGHTATIVVTDATAAIHS